MAVDAAAKTQFSQLASYLDSIGLGQLFAVDSSGNPGGWLWNQMQAGVDSVDELGFRLEQTDVFRERFGVIQEQQKRAAKGEPVTVMSPAQVLDYENKVKQLMSAAGLPSTFYDEPKDFHRLILSDMSVTEVNDRITQAYDYVLSAPPEVRAAFNEFYGVGQGDAQLASWALDPDRTVRDITRATRTAYTAGMGEKFGIQMNRAAAQSIADMPKTEAGIVQGLEQIASMSPIFTESIGEANNLTAGNEGINSVFNGSGEANSAIERRIAQRKAIDRSSTGGALTTQAGVLGAGSS
tara:strand:+ start:703 stop:1587 length:885 start_codon:yes stop_codon:yes gene_type:complete